MISELDGERRAHLIALARRTIEHGAEQRERLVPDRAVVDAFSSTPVATFVTLRVAEQLNGCIGTIEPQRPICRDIVYNAFQAAFHDPRFSPLEASALERVDIHISVLSPLERLQVADEVELLEALRPHRDGLVLEAGSRRATFLPSVWEKVPEPEDFVGHLKRKARIGPLEWPDSMQVFRYDVLEFSE